MAYVCLFWKWFNGIISLFVYATVSYNVCVLEILQFMRCFENHKVVSFEVLKNAKEAVPIHKPVFCETHPTEAMKFFCYSCMVSWGFSFFMDQYEVNKPIFVRLYFYSWNVQRIKIITSNIYYLSISRYRSETKRTDNMKCITFFKIL